MEMHYYLLARSATNCKEESEEDLESTQAVEHKISAIKALAAASSNPPMDIIEAMQHVAAGMLLCSFEVNPSSGLHLGRLDEVINYLRGVKHVIHVAGLDDVENDADLAALLYWVYYHDVLARFGARHWHRNPKGRPSASSDVEAVTGSLRAKPSKLVPPALDLIELLSDVCDVLSDGSPRPAGPEGDEYAKSSLKILEWRIRTAPAGDAAFGSVDAALVTEVYRLTMLAYLHRVTENSRSQWSRTQKYIDRAYGVLAQLGSCDRQFPVFILGCEARRDEQRAVVRSISSPGRRRAPLRAPSTTRGSSSRPSGCRMTWPAARSSIGTS
ncbi:hypothetical protein L209DRAFT_743289 [Thermothelomyces heterothallicus CBS 203.75]